MPGNATIGSTALDTGLTGAQCGAGEGPLFLSRNPMNEAIETKIRSLIADNSDDIEVLLVDAPGAGRVRVFIDHPDGVTLAHCERVTELLADVRETHAVEVSSPGAERPLTKPDHFRRFAGRTAKIKLSEPLPESGSRTISGEIVEADDETVTVATGDERLSLPYSAIGRAHLVAAA
ncbi:MAG: ribosome maturation factor RimP [Actinobacteria bacterium]|uniref:Unannotated protein n=1 Tax=freshwater metagenome TaxID=449393 RepID=A0A6J7E974_9ZZZZ|nr:ribosome maturation factor RimP [Actinomycetota bacterium]